MPLTKYRLLFLSLPLILFFASCMDEQEEPRYAIGFQTSSGNSMLRASEVDADNILDFRVWSVWTRDDKEIIYMDGMKVEKVSNNWEYSPVFYWPSEGKLDFYAYSPATSSGVLSFNARSGELIYDVTTDLARQEDFIIASTPDPAKITPVDLRFDHILSQVSFEVKNQSTKTIKIKKIELKNLYRKGIYTSGDWTIWETPTTYSAYMSDEVEVIPSASVSVANHTQANIDMGNLMILPQTTTSAAVITATYDVYDSGSVLVDNVTDDFPFPDSPAFEFEMEKKYVFHLLVTKITK